MFPPVRLASNGMVHRLMHHQIGKLSISIRPAYKWGSTRRYCVLGGIASSAGMVPPPILEGGLY